ncbi:ribonucleoside-triphosphate reductase [Candidatus Nomurabacteria bacterium RIFCSPHIGHO2_01_FULL_39_220]|uniref:Ribonucleoside-triphosphate reductase n=1 Tax=Candidatus Nomurabacteria bacterium RIFCSPLOWO2_02_FULL_40_67 TaxID=1801787 RepID=A0A1F6Y2S3_9BACT|nr:MAG: Ribonucleoside-triphosphate reductase [Parcubacteria group bacterium GW2011_GWA2_40_37]OGI62450.1 MAG: ribonucleoside-triphosphate reductase [Candidatus Nomurabacteria bacterium RBG_16_40_11]OGI70714.1 MAG: ribonucleoside-triphosphate reductase [Candidatus Nomurabacteria bacterium RIFCSPHIGHO2_01_FULL_39_220]OGI72444.1 MAG: ribonucleoside-triphosphate reductase [Candidatus Nomurabacteria bacterium RIFCSPHIGHO2_02_41_18]OGI78121.1 MAG: ribonucleoside-triphosphate reductase [Candidatus No
MEKTKKIFKSELAKIKSIRKRSGEVVPFDLEIVARAIFKAFEVSGEGGEAESHKVANRVFKTLLGLRLELVDKNKGAKFLPTVELVQDFVEKELMKQGFPETAKKYILYRSRRSELRKAFGPVPEAVRTAVEESSKYFSSPYSEYIFYQFYSRWVPELGRRETWIETIDRYMAYMKENLGDKLHAKEYEEVRRTILNQDICPSMRLLWSAGKACRNSNVWAYNCSYIAPTSCQDLGEIMYVSMCGAGLGFAVEWENVQKFPQIKKQTGSKPTAHIVNDNKEGWADAFVLGLETWFDGRDIKFDYSFVRPAGSRLETAGGRASGPQPLMDLMGFARRKILSKQGRRLSNLDMHDIICQIGMIVVAGGVRRSALISLSELEDAEMRDAKKGQFYLTEGQRSMANNSAVYNAKPSAEEFLDEWTALVKSKSGERGIFNRGGLEKQLPARRWAAIKDERQIGLNPCGEIYLRSKQFCNLTSIVIRPKDTVETLKRKMELATLLGTYQSTLTNFGYLSKKWKENCEAERLLGVSLTGYYDNPIIRDDKVLDILKKDSIETNKKYAKRFDINPSTAITCVKPHGNSGQLLGVGSGMHPWYAPYFIRRVRISHTDTLLSMARDQGVPCLPEVGQSEATATTFVLEFPVKAPEGAIFKDEVTALDLMKEWKRLKEHFVEHNPSATIYVGPNEWLAVGNFVYENWEFVGGMSFLPRSEHVYQLAPYEAITREEYERRSKSIGKIDFSKLSQYEAADNTTGAKEFACVAGVCEV